MNLKELERNANENLYVVTSIFPFKFLPCEVQVTRTHVNLLYRTSFFSSKIFPIVIKDITTLKMTESWFFGRLKFEIQGYEKNPDSIGYLPKERCLFAQRLILGLVECYKLGVDVTKYSSLELREKLVSDQGPRALLI